MKSIVIIIFFLINAFTLLGLSQGAEISFYQDSVMSNKIYVNLKLLSEQRFNGALQDSLFIIWGDGNTSPIPLVDTVRVNGAVGANFAVYNATFSGSHTYDSSSLNGFITIGCTQGNRIPSILNITQSGQEGFYLCAIINFNFLKNKTGYKSPYFQASLYSKDTIDKILKYDPSLIVSNTFITDIKLTTPLNAYLSYVSGYQLPNEIGPYGTDTTLLCDSVTGILTWNYPSNSGYYSVAYQIMQKADDTVVSIIMQDMLLTVVDATSGIKGINPYLFRCYPSPTSGSITIDMSGLETKEKQIRVYDQLGQIVFQGNTAESKLLIETPFASGVYAVEVIQDNKRDYTRFVRN